MPPFEPDSKYWDHVRVKEDGTKLYVCKVCSDAREKASFHIKAHEQTQIHQDSLKYFEADPESFAASTESFIPTTVNQRITEDALRALLASASADPNQPLYPTGYPGLVGDTVQRRSPSPLPGIDWNLIEATENPVLDQSPLQQATNEISQNLLDFLNGDLSEDEINEVPGYEGEDDLNEGELPSEQEDGFSTTPPPEKRACNHRSDDHTAREWYPWQDRITCTLDILMHLPRSVFSERQLDLFLWLLKVNNVDHVPSVKTMKAMNKLLQNHCGIQTFSYNGALGHRYFVNSLSQILAQEMCNPRVREHLHFYPKDTGNRLSEAWQADRWLNEMRPEDTTPMVRIHNIDYYIYEPAFLNNQTACIPVRWFLREGIYYAKAWPLEPTADGDWVVRQDQENEISQHQLMKNFPRFGADHQLYNVPHPSRLCGIKRGAAGEALERWRYTNPVLGNSWRERARGHRVLSLPLWMYCDDTSGNTSKKWNEHNSFLFVMAGLPREQAAKEYNIHFLCTSNSAPPLEMLDGIVSQLEDAQKQGIWAWDCLLKEPVLIFPVILALLGDNPMQSEFACHIGLRGKFFCRVCKVKGPDALDQPTPNPGLNDRDGDGGQESDAGETSDTNLGQPPSDPGDTPPAPPSPQASPAPAAAPKRGKVKETMSSMVTRVTAFLKVGTLRSKDETVSKLRSFFTQAQQVGAKTNLKKERTEVGIKDTFQEFFLQKLFTSYKGRHTRAEKERALKAAVDKLPENITSPVWRIKGLDPHQDTPVEILHVVLLGFVKYFWRDLIQNQLKANDDKKLLLSQRLISLDVSGLGISPLAGETLVQYAGSLTGRDFRAITQVAPFVIYDLVPPKCFAAWVSLSKLIPLIWQPVIENIDEYIVRLDREILDFLLHTTQWTSRWFNKPKFHIILHIPSHIRRLGPAILFATEAFESFNAVIRAKSVHSNRLAPSRDIGLAFAQGNRICHLLSGGYFVPSHIPPNPSPAALGTSELPDLGLETPIASAELWKSIGIGPTRLMSESNTATTYLGLSFPPNLAYGRMVSDRKPPRTLSQTLLGEKVPELLSNPQLTASKYKTSRSVILLNGDKCEPGNHVIVKARSGECPGEPSIYIARVEEIVNRIGSDSDLKGVPDSVLVQMARSANTGHRTQMPRLTLTDHWSSLPLQDILCTVNTQHDCEKHQCGPTGQHYIQQEHAQTSQLSCVVEHRQAIDDHILNTAQMRDAIHLQRFRIPSEPLNFDLIIQQSAAEEVNARKAAELSDHASVRGARGRGQGRGRSQGQSQSRGSRGRGHVPDDLGHIMSLGLSGP